MSGTNDPTDPAGGSAERRALLQRIETKESQLETAVSQLADAAQERIRPGHVVSQFPYRVLLGAMAVGLWLGLRR